MKRKLKSRKLVLFLILNVKNTWLAMTMGMPWDVYASIETMLFLWYVGGNVGEHLANRGQSDDD